MNSAECSLRTNEVKLGLQKKENRVFLFRGLRVEEEGEFAGRGCNPSDLG
jgi:hypothetical protein